MRVGIVGFGNLGKYLVKELLEHGKAHDIDIAFVWNRSPARLEDEIPQEMILKDLDNFAEKKADLIVEVAHPDICKKYGEHFLQSANLFVGSPTSFADSETESLLKMAVDKYGYSIYVPSGAFWGAADIKKMADKSTLKGLKVTMKKHPTAFRLEGEIKKTNQNLLEHGSGSETLYEGSVRNLCPLAPNNVNTMAAAAIAGHNLGFDGVIGCLVSDTRLLQWHVVEIEVTGPGDATTGNDFTVTTVRNNPAAAGVVTGNATYASFFSSLIRARNQGPGIHMC